VTREELHPAVERLARTHDIDGCLRLLTEELTAADLTAVLLEVTKRRAAAVSPISVLRQYERDRFVRPVQVDARRLLAVQAAALDAVDPLFEPMIPSPLVPFGASAALAEVSQNRTVSTLRNSEVLSDPTIALALEAAVRRRDARESASPDDVVRLACVARVLRAQTFDGPRSFAHFSLLGLVSAGRDTGHHRFESTAVREHISALAAAARAVGLDEVGIGVTDFSGTHGDVVDELCARPPHGVTAEPDPDRAAGRGYYPSICFKLSVEVAGELVELGDGGLADWTQPLVGSKKERLMTSGLSLERVAALSKGGD